MIVNNGKDSLLERDIKLSMDEKIKIIEQNGVFMYGALKAVRDKFYAKIIEMDYDEENNKVLYSISLDLHDNTYEPVTNEYVLSKNQKELQEHVNERKTKV